MVLRFALGHVWISKLLRCVTKMSAREDCRVGQKLSNRFSFCLMNNSCTKTCRSSRLIRLRFNSITQRQMFRLLYGSPPRGTKAWRIHTKLSKSGQSTPSNNLRMKNSRDLILGEVVDISIICHIPYLKCNLLNGYGFKVWSPAILKVAVQPSGWSRSYKALEQKARLWESPDIIAKQDKRVSHTCWIWIFKMTFKVIIR